MLSVNPMSDGSYPGRHVAETLRNAGRRGVKADYFSRAVAAGEQPGTWGGPGLADIGIAFGSEVSQEQMETVFTKLLHPQTGQQLGRKAPTFAGPAENLAAKAVDHGVELPEHLTPAAIAKAMAGRARSAHDRDLQAAVAAQLEPEQAAQWQAEVRQSKTKEGRTYSMLTFAPDKSFGVFEAAAETVGRFDVADVVRAAESAGVGAAMDFLLREAAFAQAGTHSCQQIDAPRWIWTTFPHGLSREGDPHPHEHVNVLNRVLCPDGRWRATDVSAIFAVREQAAAIYERTSAEYMARELGLRFETAPNGWSRRIVGIREETIRLFSKRDNAIEVRLDEWEAKYRSDHGGRSPDARLRDAQGRRISLAQRKAKPAEMDTHENTLAGWEAEMAADRGASLADDFAAAMAVARTPITAPLIDVADVTARAVALLGERQETFTASQLSAEINRQLPDELGGIADVDALLTRLTRTALDSPDVTINTAPDVIGDAPDHRRRQSDGLSIYSTHGCVRYTLTSRLDAEQRIASRALVTHAPTIGTLARAVAKRGLTVDQAAAADAILSSGLSLEVLSGCAGSGKSTTVSAIAKAWRMSGRDAIGLALSENASRELGRLGVAKTANIRAFLTSVPKVAEGTLIVVDEASMVSTTDLAAIVDLATEAEAKVLLVGDEMQLEAIEGGGMMAYVASWREANKMNAVHHLTTVKRFTHQWEAERSVDLRAGDRSALDAYDRHGRILGGTSAEMMAEAVAGYVADYRTGQEALLLSSNIADGRAMATMVRARLIADGSVSDGDAVALRGGCVASEGDWIVCRKIDRTISDPSGEIVANRDVFAVVRVHEDGSLDVRRQLEGGRWGRSFNLPARYVAAQVDLAYAATVHASQGRTVGRGHLLVDAAMRRSMFYVGMTRGKDENLAYVVTETPERAMNPFGDDGRHDLAATDVLAGVLDRSDVAVAAIEARRQSFDASESLARLGHAWTDVCGDVTRHTYRQTLAELCPAALEDDSATTLMRQMAAAQAHGHDPRALVAIAVAQRDFDGVRDHAAVLQTRIAALTNAQVSDPEPRLSYVDRSPEPLGLPPLAPDPHEADIAYARRIAMQMDQRRDALAEAAAVDHRLDHVLGQVPDDPLVRLDWLGRAGPVEAYVEQYLGSKHAEAFDPIGRAPDRGREPERYESWRLADDALGKPDRHRDVSRMADRELRQAVSTWDEMLRTAPANVREDLDQLRADYRRAVQVDRGRPGIRTKGLEAQVIELDGAQSRRDEFWESSAVERTTAEEARLELTRRGHAQVAVPDVVAEREQSKRLEQSPSLADDFTLRL